MKIRLHSIFDSKTHFFFCKIAPNVNEEDAVGTVLPYAGVIHQTDVLEDAKTMLPEIQNI